MFPDPRWDDAMSASKAGQFVPRPGRFIEFIAHKSDDVEVVTGDLTPENVLLWLDGQVSQDRLHLGQYTDSFTPRHQQEVQVALRPSGLD